MQSVVCDGQQRANAIQHPQPASGTANAAKARQQRLTGGTVVRADRLVALHHAQVAEVGQVGRACRGTSGEAGTAISSACPPARTDRDRAPCAAAHITHPPFPQRPPSPSVPGPRAPPKALLPSCHLRGSVRERARRPTGRRSSPCSLALGTSACGAAPPSPAGSRRCRPSRLRGRLRVVGDGVWTMTDGVAGGSHAERREAGLGRGSEPLLRALVVHVAPPDQLIVVVPAAHPGHERLLRRSQTGGPPPTPSPLPARFVWRPAPKRAGRSRPRCALPRQLWKRAGAPSRA